ncbi:MAE_28990/MAE_18760 family HEPN-like nuclease [Aliarcobacter butzleri]|uniref:MAE_28990/MAE_18760 family HEPN-like nuclease n=1 Tax=Aliarcobacter butzleri TaxID=28197 RepID=UPI001EDACEDC|nr:MAE_28990/MAE_18760 family HEPN-like nuclease [Aliarcobacter butzleri]MCG3671911.1 hypothetical protein [Aliarcobacter butzleri]
MTINELREEMESELTWRSDELRMLKNNLQFIIKEEDKSKYRKSLVVMLYANFEGFCKICLLSYIKYLNNLSIKRKDISRKPELIASSMYEIFKLYDDKDRKNRVFKTTLPNDTNLHSVFRRADLIREFDNFMEERILLNDEVVNTESNLWAHVLSKNLYILGINPDSFKHYNVDIDRLVNIRNSIAHGTERRGITEKSFEKLEKCIIKTVMPNLITILTREANLFRIA